MVVPHDQSLRTCPDDILERMLLCILGICKGVLLIVEADARIRTNVYKRCGFSAGQRGVHWQRLPWGVERKVIREEL